MPKMLLSRSNIRSHLSLAAFFFGTAFSTLALTSIAPALTNAAWSANQFQFTLLGETNVSYILESSSNLRTWTPAITNSDSQATRTVIVPAVSPQTFWRVRPIPGPLFEHAIVARGGVILGGSGRIDSFNSTNTLESTASQYDPANATDRATVATASGSTNALFVGNMSVYGSVRTAPGGAVTLGPNGNVGSSVYNNNPAYNGTIEPGRVRNDFQVALPVRRLPMNFAPLLMPQNVLYPPSLGGTNYTYAVLADGDYRSLGHLSIGSGQKMLITARCRIHVVGNTTVQSSGYVLMGPDASVEWYCSGRVDIQGQGFINMNGFARNLSIIALTAQPVNYAGQARLIGTIYAPSAPVTLNGTTDAIGAIVCNSFSIAGSMSLHFDESLKSEGPFY